MFCPDLLLLHELVYIYSRKYNSSATNDGRKSRLAAWRPYRQRGYDIQCLWWAKLVLIQTINMLLTSDYQLASLASCIQLIKYCTMCHFDLSSRLSYP